MRLAPEEVGQFTIAVPTIVGIEGSQRHAKHKGYGNNDFRLFCHGVTNSC